MVTKKLFFLNLLKFQEIILNQKLDILNYFSNIGLKSYAPIFIFDKSKGQITFGAQDLYKYSISIFTLKKYFFIFVFN